jgi:hypothetical protein
MKKIQATIISTVAPTTNETIANGYALGQWWQNTTTGEKYYHKTDGVWVEIGDIESIQTQNVTSNATTGTITLAKQTVTTLTTTLTNAHTLTIIPEKPTVFTTRNYQELFLTVGATAPSITWSAPSGVTLDWKGALGEPTTGLKINTMHSLFFDWQSDTYCIIQRKEL